MLGSVKDTLQMGDKVLGLQKWAVLMGRKICMWRSNRNKWALVFFFSLWESKKS